MQLLVKTFSVLSLLALLSLAGCRSASVESAEYQRIVDRISGIVGKQLDLDVSEVDVDLPLSKQKKAADDLDVVEIIMNVEEAFNIQIQDDEVEVSTNLSVRQLADIVSKKKSRK